MLKVNLGKVPSLSNQVISQYPEYITEQTKEIYPSITSDYYNSVCLSKPSKLELEVYLAKNPDAVFAVFGPSTSSSFIVDNKSKIAIRASGYTERMGKALGSFHLSNLDLYTIYQIFKARTACKTLNPNYPRDVIFDHLKFMLDRLSKSSWTGLGYSFSSLYIKYNLEVLRLNMGSMGSMGSMGGIDDSLFYYNMDDLVRYFNEVPDDLETLEDELDSLVF
jgi:hypothetical protein